MAINILKYQPVLFLTDDQRNQENCDCTVKPFCQLVNKSDKTQWQIISTNIVSNGTFDNDLEDWVISEGLTANLSTTNETYEGACNGEIEVTASGGTGPYEYSIDGTNFQNPNTFSLLCTGCYNVIVRDSLGNVGFATGCIDTNVDCSLYNSPDLYDLANEYISKLKNCYLNDLI